MKEIVTIQVGDYANYIGSHFWNFQVYICYFLLFNDRNFIHFTFCLLCLFVSNGLNCVFLFSFSDYAIINVFNC